MKSVATIEAAAPVDAGPASQGNTIQRYRMPAKDDVTAKHLQTVAWDTVQDYFGTAVPAK